MTLADRKTPYNLGVEAALLGGIIRDPLAMIDVRPLLEADDFFRGTHQRVYRTLCKLSDAGRPYDTASLVFALEAEEGERFESDHLDDCVIECLNADPGTGLNLYNAEIVKDLSRRRSLIHALNESLNFCYRGDATFEQMQEVAEQAVFAVTDEATKESKLIGDFADEVMIHIENRQLGMTTGLATGFRKLDILTAGLSPKTLNVVAARPSIGKTAFALNLCENVVFQQQVPVFFASLEMGGAELAERLIVSRSGVFGSKVRAGADLTDVDHRAIAVAYQALRATKKFFVDDRPSRSVAQIAANARRHKLRHDIGLVVIDYIQLIEERGGDRRASRQEQVAAISRRLKVLAKELDLPVLALSQLNRESERRNDKMPQLADLRESGAIEQDADTVLLLHRPEFYDRAQEPGKAYLIVAKNRAGATRTLSLAFDKRICKFDNITIEQPTNGATY